MKRRSKDEPTWVYNERYGWLVDECPLFEALFYRGGQLRVADGHSVVADERVVTLDDLSYSCLLVGIVASHGYSPYGTAYAPLTAAARELLAALKAEQGSR